MIQLLDILSIITLYIVILNTYEKRTTSVVYKMISYVFMTLLVQSLGVFIQLYFTDTLKINPIYYEYFIYLGKATMPTVLLLFAIVYDNPRADIKKFSWLFFLPIFLITMIWTNDMHNMFFIKYTSITAPIEYGFMYYIYIGIVLAQIIPAVLSIIKTTIDKSSFFSPQTILMIISIVIPFIPLVINIFQIGTVPSYIMVISYMFTAIILSFNILKYNVLNSVPVALRSVIDVMSDAFVVLSLNGDMVDTNRSFISKLSEPLNLKLNKNIYDVIKFEGIKDLKKLKNAIPEALDSGKTLYEECHIVKNDFDRYFDIQIQPIKARTSKGFIAVLLVFRDITEQKINLDVIIKKENLSVVGELAGGVAHEINTPISAIKSGLLMLRDTVKSKEEKQIIENMTNSADKISNLVNSLKNQIRNLGSFSDTEFSLTELLQELYIIMHSEFSKNNIRININNDTDIWIAGNTAKLTQVITNIINNSIKAYGNKGGIIDINIYKDDKENNVIMIEDWAGGIPEEIRPYIFKKIIKVNDMPTTGIGLYLAYSVIKGDFGGDIKFETKEGKGTKFYIILPNK